MARKRRKMSLQAGELNLTAMIDIGFQLLNFFVITAHPIAVFTNLDILRPAPDSIQAPSAPPSNQLEIIVYKYGYSLQKRNVDLATVNNSLVELAQFGKENIMIVIKCTNDSTQQGLVKVLDLCAKIGITNISLFSM